jgi:Cd2+/Zn2+-exporting ATPase
MSTSAHEDPKAPKHHATPGDGLGGKTDLVFAIICGVLLATGFGLTFFESVPDLIWLMCYIGAYFFGGFFTVKQAIASIRAGHFDIDFLMLVAAIGAAVLGEWAEGALLLFLFSLGHALEHYALEKARKSITALAELAPKTALLKNGNIITEVSIDELKPGDVIVVKPNSKIAADGLVVSGSSAVNEAPITGESVPVDKMPVEDWYLSQQRGNPPDAKHSVFAGSINGGEVLEVKVTKPAADSTIARLVKLVNEAQAQKSPTQNFAEKLEKVYVPVVLLLVVILLFAFVVIDEPFSASFYRAMSVLVAASPCALAISTPSAVLSGIARAARGGVLIKGGRPLEELGSLTAIAFDKTGTLTEGKPKLTGVYALNGVANEELMEIVVAVEQLSDHPLATAIVKGVAETLKRDVPAASRVEALAGRGVKATYKGASVQIGNKTLFEENGSVLPAEIKEQAERMEQAGHTTMLVRQNDRFIGVVTLMDVPRTDARRTLERLSALGIRKMVMLTGDNQKVAEAIAKDIGMTDAMGSLLPEQKIAAIESLRATENKIAMVGDGVNDAPAMAKSTVGIAMGAAGSAVALETADVALMADRLSNLPFAIGLSRKAHRIIRQNIFISLGMVALLVPLTIFGIASLGPAVVGHEGSTVVVVFNALRLLVYKES